MEKQVTPLNESKDVLADRRQSWSAYWASGALHSCVGSFEGNYAGQVREFWRGFASGLPQGARLLDVASGNGALPALFIQDAPADRTLDIDAVDLAAVQPDWLGGLDEAVRRRTRFHPGVVAESLPFADASFDACVSQFGIEYTDLARSVPELRRVLRAGGRVGLVLHSTESLILRQAREELGHLAWLLDEAGLIEVGDGLCDAFALAATPEGIRRLQGDAHATSLRATYNDLMRQGGERAAASPCPDAINESREAVAQALMACRASGSAQPGRQALAALVARLHESRLRLRELVDCALDRDAAENLLAPAGIALDKIETLRFGNGEVMGWALAGRLPG